MESFEGYAVIRVTEIKEDPSDDSAYGITCDVLGPGDFVDTVRVSFTDNFIRRYYKIPWFKELAAEEHRFIKKDRDLFLKWALIKIEQWIRNGEKEESKKMIITEEKDLEWTRMVAEGKGQPSSKSRGDQEYVLTLNGR